MCGAIPPLSNMPSWHGAHLKRKHRDFILLYFIWSNKCKVNLNIIEKILLYRKMQLSLMKFIQKCKFFIF
jgi:hypothetical protein